MKRLKNGSTVTLDLEINRNSMKPISNQWCQLKQDNNRNHYISQPPIETVESSSSNIVSRKKRKIFTFSDSILKKYMYRGI